MSLEGLDLMAKRLQFLGGYTTQDRLIKGKERTFEKAARQSAYQSCVIKWKDQNFNALINPDKTKADYDDKILSVNTEIYPGSVFEWVGTDTMWLVVLPELTEKAYFRGSIRRCRYKLNWLDKENVYHSEWAAIRGPVETKINSGYKANVAHDDPNETLHILMPDSEANREAFFRYDRFIFMGRAWEVQSSDYISTEGVLEFTAKEDYLNKDIDDKENNLADRVTIEKIDPNAEEDSNQGPKIWGETFINPQVSYEYYVSGVADAAGSWQIKEDNRPVQVETSNNRISIKWCSNIAGQFTLEYITDSLLLSKKIVVESLF